MDATTRRFIRRLKTLRAQHGYSQQTLSTHTGLTREYIARLELGQHDPSLSVLVKLATALKVTVGGLVD